MKKTCSRCGGKCGGPWGNRCYRCHPGGSAKTGEDRKCEVCGQSVYVGGAQLKRYVGGGTYCSRKCTRKGLKGRKFRLKKKETTRYTTQAGYVLVKVGIHEWEFEHRLVVEKRLGRKLQKDETVHHINQIRNDNRPSNLEVLSRTEHMRMHGKQGNAIRYHRGKH